MLIMPPPHPPPPPPEPDEFAHLGIELQRVCLSCPPPPPHPPPPEPDEFAHLGIELQRVCLSCPPPPPHPPPPEPHEFARLGLELQRVCFVLAAIQIPCGHGRLKYPPTGRGGHVQGCLPCLFVCFCGEGHRKGGVLLFGTHKGPAFSRTPVRKGE